MVDISRRCRVDKARQFAQHAPACRADERREIRHHVRHVSETAAQATADNDAEARLFRPTHRRSLTSSPSILHRDECTAGAYQAKRVAECGSVGRPRHVSEVGKRSVVNCICCEKLAPRNREEAAELRAFQAHLVYTSASSRRAPCAAHLQRSQFAIKRRFSGCE
jgi:hypothetical protein